MDVGNIAELNTFLLLDAIRSRGEATRRQLGRELGLSDASVSRIVKRLLATGIIEELPGEGAMRGRTPSILLVHSTTPGMFAAGADIRETRDRGSDHALRAINAGLFERLEAHRWPTIALVDGPALGGGCEMALACDFRLATERAVFGQPELSLGILAGAGANWRLAQLAGLGTARRMLYTGARLTAAEALQAGLVDEIAADVTAAGRDMAATIAERSCATWSVICSVFQMRREKRRCFARWWNPASRCRTTLAH